MPWQERCRRPRRQPVPHGPIHGFRQGPEVHIFCKQALSCLYGSNADCCNEEQLNSDDEWHVSSLLPAGSCCLQWCSASARSAWTLSQTTCPAWTWPQPRKRPRCTYSASALSAAYAAQTKSCLRSGACARCCAAAWACTMQVPTLMTHCNSALSLQLILAGPYSVANSGHAESS